jgi:hypothetical protein
MMTAVANSCLIHREMRANSRRPQTTPEATRCFAPVRSYRAYDLGLTHDVSGPIVADSPEVEPRYKVAHATLKPSAISTSTRVHALSWNACRIAWRRLLSHKLFSSSAALVFAVPPTHRLISPAEFGQKPARR